MRRYFIVFLAGLAAQASVQPAMACSCVKIDPVAAYRIDGTVVLVKVTGVETTPDLSPWTITIVILKSWKGAWRPNVTTQVQTPGPRGLCGFFIRVGDEFLIYSEDPVTLKNVHLCNTVTGDEVPIQIRQLDALSHNQGQSPLN